MVKVATLVLQWIDLLHRIYFKYIARLVAPVAQELAPHYAPAVVFQLAPFDETDFMGAHVT
jgi:hypothetical protein